MLLDTELSGRPVGLSCYLTEEEFLQILKGYMFKLLEPMIGSLKPGEIFVEKTPSHALFIPEITELLPKARIIHVVRDARDVVASLLSASKSWGANWAPRNARGAARMWIRHVRAVKEAAGGLPADQFYEVRYEDLYASTKETLRGIIDFLRLKWDDEGMQKAIDQNRFDVARTTGGTKIELSGEWMKRLGEMVKEPLGFMDKGKPGRWREDLSFLDQLVVWQVAHRTMEEVGYSWTLPQGMKMVLSCAKPLYKSWMMIQRGYRQGVRGLKV